MKDLITLRSELGTIDFYESDQMLCVEASNANEQYCYFYEFTLKQAARLKTALEMWLLEQPK